MDTPSWIAVTNGIKVCWKWITPACEKTHGSYEQALEVALDDVRQKFREALPGWAGKARFHVALVIEPIPELKPAPEPDPNRPGVVATDGIDPDYAGGGAPKGINPATGQHESYWTLSEEERAKGFIRPVRRGYRHVGKQPTYETRPLTEDEQRDNAGRDYVAYEKHPEDSSIVGRFWTQARLDSGCGASTTMALAIAETFARDLSFYGSTFCTQCGDHFPVDEFAWDGTDERVGS